MAGTERDAMDGNDGAVPEVVHTDGVLGGDPRIEGTRIGVFHVFQRYVEGDESPVAIADGYDISLAAVHAALAYGFANPDEMEAIEERRQQAVEDAPDRVRPRNGE